jgi:hypothetical protein
MQCAVAVAVAVRAPAGTDRTQPADGRRGPIIVTKKAFAAGLTGLAVLLGWTMLAGTAGAAVGIGDLPADRLPPAGWVDTQWADPGGFVTVDVTSRGLPADSPTVDASARLRSILATAVGRTVLYFPPGAYYFRTDLTITHDDVILRGAGLDRTKLIIAAPGTANAQIAFRGADVGTPLPVSGSPAAGGQSVTVPNSGPLATGDFVQLYLDGGRKPYGYASETQIFRIVSKSGSTLNLDMKIGLPYPAAKAPVVQEIDMLRTAGVERLRIERTNQPTLENVNNLVLERVHNAFVRDIESVRSGRSHISIDWSKNVVVERNLVHGAFVQNAGGYAYGVAMNWGTNRVRVTDNKIWDLRHGIMVQLGANHNVIGYNSVEAPFNGYNDIALHANWAYMNLFEGNRFTEGYADNSKAGQGSMDPTGPGNTWFRNWASGQIGSINAATTRQNVIGNKLSLIRLSGTDHYHGANKEGDVVKWGSLSASSQIPASLYLAAKPAFLGSTPFPVYGPSIVDWGVANTLPAALRARP